jgi:hypothetical protein
LKKYLHCSEDDEESVWSLLCKDDDEHEKKERERERIKKGKRKFLRKAHKP